jgi:hypothetical protein
VQNPHVTGTSKVLDLVDYVVLLTTLDHEYVLLPERSEFTRSAHFSLVAD